jgi:hypothetical protein
MVRVFGEHAAREVIQNRRQALTTGDCNEITEFKLAIHDGSVVGTVHRRAAQGQRYKQDAKCVHIVGGAAFTTCCRMTESGIGGLANCRLVHGGWGRPGSAQSNWTIWLDLEDVVGAYSAVGDAARLKLLQHRGDRSHDEFNQSGFRPRPKTA